MNEFIENIKALILAFGVSVEETVGLIGFILIMYCISVLIFCLVFKFGMCKINNKIDSLNEDLDYNIHPALKRLQDLLGTGSEYGHSPLYIKWKEKESIRSFFIFLRNVLIRVLIVVLSVLMAAFVLSVTQHRSMLLIQFIPIHIVLSFFLFLYTGLFMECVELMKWAKRNPELAEV